MDRSECLLDYDKRGVLAAVAFLIISTVCATHLFWYMPCFIQMFGFQTFGMFWAACVLFKGVKFYYEFKVNQAKLFGADVASSSGSTGHLDVGSVAEERSGTVVSPISTSRSSTAIADATSYLQESYHWRHRYRATDRYLGNVALVLVAVDVAVLIVNQVSSPRFRLIPEVYRSPGCYSEWEYYPLWAIMCLYLLVCCPFMIYKIRSAKDNHGVQRELMLIVFAGLPLWILFLMWDFLDEALYTKFPSANWWIILMFVTHTFSIVIPVYHAVKADHLRKALTLKQNTTSFLQVLAERTVWEDFKKFMAADFCIENALFFEAHEELMAMVTTAYVKAGILGQGSACMSIGLPGHRRSSAQPLGNSSRLPSLDGTSSATVSTVGVASFQAAPGARGLSRSSATSGQAGHFASLPVPPAMQRHYRMFWELYLKPGSPHEVNVPSKHRDEVQVLIAEGRFTAGMFEACKQEVLQNMFLNSYASFLRKYNSEVSKPQPKKSVESRPSVTKVKTAKLESIRQSSVAEEDTSRGQDLV
ncbi:hypothetical protein HDU85_005879 [Gaertneriomyces sp. JEL0708]|nr:hypothetical protein HDU85_005879 [Gaertneriomyces sp. JEL0708]